MTKQRRAVSLDLSLDLLERTIRQRHTALLRLIANPDYTRTSLLTGRAQLAGLIEAHLITAVIPPVEEPRTVLQQYALQAFQIDLARLGTMIETKGH